MNDDKKTTIDAPLIVIAGPTASGKSAVGMEIAKEFGGEIICADSRTSSCCQFSVFGLDFTFQLLFFQKLARFFFF